MGKGVLEVKRGGYSNIIFYTNYCYVDYTKSYSGFFFLQHIGIPDMMAAENNFMQLIVVHCKP